MCSIVKIYYFIQLMVFTFYVDKCESIKVCKTFDAYYESDTDLCYDNSDTSLNVTEILTQHWGCNVKEHYVTTKDGYKLLLVRAFKEITHPTPIVVAHGLFMNSIGFLSLHNQSLVYRIIESGRQVFLINFRGTQYSKSHVNNLTHDDFEYWKFSFHEMGEYDLPAVLEFVKTSTTKKAVLLNFSMGATAGFIYASIFPKKASDNLIGIISLAPAVFFEHSTSIAIYSIVADMNIFLNFANIGRWPREKFMSTAEYASKGPTEWWVVYQVISKIVGNDPNATSSKHFPVVALNTPETIPMFALNHYAQMVLSHRFQKYDYGYFSNLERYGSIRPPEYPLAKITVPVALIHGSGDVLTTSQDGKKLYSLLNPIVRCGSNIIPYEGWAHDSFVDSQFQVKYLVPMVMEKIETMESNRCDV